MATSGRLPAKTNIQLVLLRSIFAFRVQLQLLLRMHFRFKHQAYRVL
jgi:hypothetical protein